MLRALSHRRTKADDGFTLIELLIVILILGVLAAVVIFSVRGINNDSEQTACKSNFATAVTAAEAYYAENTADAASWADLVPDFLHSDPSNTGNTAVDVGGTPAAPTEGSGC